VDIHYTPAAIPLSNIPALIFEATTEQVSSPDEQRRLIVTIGVV